MACCSPWSRKESDTTEWLNWLYFIKRTYREIEGWGEFVAWPQDGSCAWNTEANVWIGAQLCRGTERNVLKKMELIDDMTYVMVLIGYLAIHQKVIELVISTQKSNNSNKRKPKDNNGSRKNWKLYREKINLFLYGSDVGIFKIIIVIETFNTDLTALNMGENRKGSRVAQW